jgi:hypothetical protein
MHRKSDWIELGLLGLAFVLMYAGVQLKLSTLVDVGSASIGAFALVAGIQAIRTKRLGFETRQRNFGPISMYTGLAAQLLGVVLAAFALAVFGLSGATLFYPGGAEAFWADFLGQAWGWGLILLGVGLALVILGVVRLMAGSAGYYRGMPDLVERVSGIIPLLIGFGMAFLGFLLIVVPGLVMGLARIAMTSAVHWIFH